MLAEEYKNSIPGQREADGRTLEGPEAWEAVIDNRYRAGHSKIREGASPIKGQIFIVEGGSE